MNAEISQIGRNIKAMREMRKMSPKELADKLGLSPRTIQNIESGSTDISYTRFKEIADALQTPISELDRLHTDGNSYTINQPNLQDQSSVVNHGQILVDKAVYEAHLNDLRNTISMLQSQNVQLMELLKR
jgi:transcriptional regulator with XRE-family HTH domain